MVYTKNPSFQSYEFYREKLNPESENSLISGVFTLPVLMPGISAETGLKNSKTRTRGRKSGWSRPFWRFIANPACRIKCHFLCFGSMGPGGCFWIESAIRKQFAGIFSRVPVTREGKERIFSSCTCEFYPIQWIKSCCVGIWRLLFIVLSRVLIKNWPRTDSWMRFSPGSISRFSRLFLSNILSA
jgi:hypothetical protein